MSETAQERGARLARAGLRDDGKLTDAEIAAEARQNHIWLNAFACVNPTTEFAAAIGREVIAMLNASDIRDAFIGRTNVAYLRVNKS